MPTNLKTAIRRRINHTRFPGPTGYWEQRYAAGGTSGAGSYGLIAQWKADQLNRLVDDHGIRSVIEFGCGDGHQLTLARYPHYLGLDVSPTAVDLAAATHRGDPAKSFLLYDPARWHNHGAVTAELGLSLDVIEHLVDDGLLAAHLDHLARAATRYLAFFTEDQKPNPGAAHVRYRNVADWAPLLGPAWALHERVDNPLKGADTQADLFVFGRVDAM